VHGEVLIGAIRATRPGTTGLPECLTQPKQTENFMITTLRNWLERPLELFKQVVGYNPALKGPAESREPLWGYDRTRGEWFIINKRAPAVSGPKDTLGLAIARKRKLLLELTLAARYLADKNVYHEEVRKKYADWGRSIQAEDSLLF
jgi:hypothetical protein